VRPAICLSTPPQESKKIKTLACTGGGEVAAPGCPSFSFLNGENMSQQSLAGYGAEHTGEPVVNDEPVEAVAPTVDEQPISAEVQERMRFLALAFDTVADVLQDLPVCHREVQAKFDLDENGGTPFNSVYNFDRCVWDLRDRVLGFAVRGIIEKYPNFPIDWDNLNRNFLQGCERGVFDPDVLIRELSALLVDARTASWDAILKEAQYAVPSIEYDSYKRRRPTAAEMVKGSTITFRAHASLSTGHCWERSGDRLRALEVLFRVVLRGDDPMTTKAGTLPGLWEGTLAEFLEKKTILAYGMQSARRYKNGNLRITFTTKENAVKVAKVLAGEEVG